MILDANIAVALLIEHPLSTAARALGPREFAAPQAILSEVANTLWKYVTFSGLPETHALEAIQHVKMFCSLVPDETLVSDALHVAIASRHPVYDCLYLALAQQRGESLVTGDNKLAALARQLAIEVELIEPAVYPLKRS